MLFSPFELGSLSLLLLQSLKGCCIDNAFSIIIIITVSMMHKQTKSLTHFFSLSKNIATTPIITINMAPLPLFSQGGMFHTTAFNGDISTWDVSSSISFVSGLGLMESRSCCCCRLLSSGHCLCFCCCP